MPDHGAERWNECCRWAGLLAEQGVALITIEPGDGESARQLHARTTGLPGLMISAPVGTVVRWAGGELRLTETGWNNVAPDGTQPGG